MNSKSINNLDTNLYILHIFSLQKLKIKYHVQIPSDTKIEKKKIRTSTIAIFFKNSLL